MEPCAGEGPIVLDRTRRDLERLGSLLDSQSAEIAAFEHTGLTRAQPRQLLEGIVEIEETFGECIHGDRG